MSDPEHHSESDPSHPDQTDLPYNQFFPLTRWVAELIASGELDPSNITATGDGSTLPPGLREMVQKWLQEQEQANNGTPPPPDIPPSPDSR